MEPLLRLIQLSKSFGTLPAVQQVNLDVAPGEVVGLAGQSGSGKSVIAMLLAGLYTPDMGDVYFEGRRLQWPFAGRKLGIEVIHQKPDLAESLDISSNIFLGSEVGWPSRTWFTFPSRRKIDRAATQILARMNVAFPSLHETVANLSSEQRQLVAIARAMARPARLIVVDEPTVVLSYASQQTLLALIQEWQQQGITVIFCSDNLDHLFAVTDRIVALREGRCVAAWRTDETTREDVVAMLVGADRRQSTPTIWALDSYYRAREQSEQLRAHELLLQRNLEAQDSLNRQLVERLAEQVQALDRANVGLQDAQRRLLTEREQERKHLARELHDDVIQDLLSLNYQLEEMLNIDEAPPTLNAEIDDVRQSIRRLVDGLRQICGNLRPPTIDSFGLGSAIQSFTREWSERSGIVLDLDLDPNLGRLPEAIELSIFRIIQEGLSNVRKHARASAVAVTLRHTSPRTLQMTIADNGRGLTENFDPAQLSASGHYGLLGMSERVALLGGRFRLNNQPGGGLRVEVEIPHPRVEKVLEPGRPPLPAPPAIVAARHLD